MQNIEYVTHTLLKNHIYKIIVIHWISYQPFEQQGIKVRMQSILSTMYVLAEVVSSVAEPTAAEHNLLRDSFIPRAIKFYNSLYKSF